MQKVTLYTKDGSLVSEVEIPPFLEGKGPEVIIWGNRVFTGQWSNLKYFEVFSYTVPISQ
jgi:hypothetical protein